MKKIGLAVVAAIVAAVSWYWVANRPPYPILDSGYRVQEEVDAFFKYSAYWLDNDRLLFVGSHVEATGPDALSIRLWDTRTNQISEFKKGARGLCFRDGFLHYTIHNSNQTYTVGEGPWGNVKERTIPETPRSPDAQFKVRNFFTCHDVDLRQLPGYGDDRNRLPLRDEHGFLEMGKKFLGSPDMPLRLFPPGNTVGIELPLKQWQVTEKPVTYVEFANAYLMYAPQPALRTGITTWPKNQPYPVHFLSPDGKVRTVNIPYIKGMSSSAHFWTLRDGIVVSVGDHPRRAGAYFAPNGKGQPQRLIDGFILPATVSPDGCKLAFNHSPYNDKVKGGLKIINFCK